MAWVTIIELLLKGLAGLTDYLNSRQLLDAGKAQAISAGLQQTLDNMSKADAVKKELADHPDGDFADSVRKKYERTDN